jgi:hypothetical protein
MIECTPEILDSISYKRREVQRNIFENPKVVRAFAGLKIILGENFVAVSNSAELENLGFKVEDVLVGPVNFD